MARLRTRLPRTLRRLAFLAAIAYCLYAVLLTALQRRILFPRHVVEPLPAAGRGVPGLETWWLNIPDGRVEAWFLPGEGISAAAPGPAVIFAHGNAELIDYLPDWVAVYRHAGVSVLLPEYRGYGRSAGDPSEAAITADLIALYDRLALHPAVDAARIVFHGRSLGGGAVCALAAHRPPRALILESTFTSVPDVARRFFLAPRFLIVDRFENARVLAELDVPTLIMHGRRDDVIPFSHGERLAEIAPRARFVPLDCGHNDCPPDEARWWQEIARLLSESGVASPAPAPRGAATPE